jgi:hypothetical protein
MSCEYDVHFEPNKIEFLAAATASGCPANMTFTSSRTRSTASAA